MVLFTFQIEVVVVRSDLDSAMHLRGGVCSGSLGLSRLATKVFYHNAGDVALRS